MLGHKQLRVDLACKAAACAVVMALAPLALAQTSVLVNPGDQSEDNRSTVANAWRGALEAALRKAGAAEVRSQISGDASADLAATRSGLYDVMLAPSPTIGSAVRFDYVPLASVSAPARAVLVVPQASAIGNWAQSQGKRLGLPGQDSVVTYLLRGEVQAGNTTLARQYASVYQTRYQDALLTCLELRRCDVVAVEQAVAQRWLGAGKPVKVIWQSREVPGLTVALRKGAGVPAEALRSALVPEAARVAASVVNAQVAARDFDYVATLGYFTPRVLAGATLVEDPAQVEKLLAAGARYIDTRTPEEFSRGHVPGALLVPYTEKSSKDPGYDAALDRFDLQPLGANKQQPLVFACNGAECWKSFKASRAALQAGYTTVYWFRTGYPAWRDAGRAVRTGSAS